MRPRSRVLHGPPIRGCNVVELWTAIRVTLPPLLQHNSNKLYIPCPRQPAFYNFSIKLQTAHIINMANNNTGYDVVVDVDEEVSPEASSHADLTCDNADRDHILWPRTL